MKIVVIGATGTIGSAVVKLLKQRHQVVAVSRSSGDYRADIISKDSLETAFGAIGKVDAIVSATGGAVFKPLAVLTDADFEKSLHDKLMGQVNIVRVGSQHVLSGGSITLTSGVLAQRPMPGSAAISLVNAGLEGFARAAFSDLANFEATKAELATDIVEALAVALGKLSFRSLLQPADGNDENTHARTLTCAPVDSHR